MMFVIALLFIGGYAGYLEWTHENKTALYRRAEANGRARLNYDG